MPRILISGAEKLSGDFLALERAEKTRTLRDAVQAGAKVAQESIKARVPVRSGLLKRNIVRGVLRSQSPQNSQTATVKIRRVKKKYASTKANRRKGKAGSQYEADGPAFYGKMVELGTVKMRAQPFLRPGFDAAESEISKAVEDTIAAGIDKVLSGGK